MATENDLHTAESVNASLQGLQQMDGQQFAAWVERYGVYEQSLAASIAYVLDPAVRQGRLLPQEAMEVVHRATSSLLVILRSMEQAFGLAEAA